MLRVVAELDDVEMAVVSFDEMRLGAAAHLSDQSDRIYRHELRGACTEGREKAAAGIGYLKNYELGRKRQHITSARRASATKDEVALELMRFIAHTTGMGKTSSGPGFGGKSPKTPENRWTL